MPRGGAESPWKTLSRERWDADHGEGDFDRRLEREFEEERARKRYQSGLDLLRGDAGELEDDEP